jgi:CRP-like cAMP-binding protein
MASACPVSEMADDRLEALRSAPAFAGLPEETLQRLAGVATEAEFPAGHVLIEYDAPAAGLFLVLEGRVAVHAPEATRELGAGEVVGELALAREAPRSARVRAVTPVRCLCLASEHVDPELAQQLARA